MDHRPATVHPTVPASLLRTGALAVLLGVATPAAVASATAVAETHLRHR